MSGQTAHGVAVARWFGPKGWRGVWIVGEPGAGKSDLALRMIAQDWRLCADDHAHLFASGGRLWAAAPERIAGLIEARGVGLTGAAFRALAPVDLVVRPSFGPVERMPQEARVTLAGVAVPAIALDAREASAVEKVAAALASL